MTQQTGSLSYASPMLKPDRHGVPVYLIVAGALAAGVIGANSFADAAGFPIVANADRDAGYVLLRIMCGVILALLTAALLAGSGRLWNALAAGLSRTNVRPETAVVITLIVAGAACLLGSVFIPIYYARNGPASVQMSTSGDQSFVVGTQLPTLSIISTLMTLVIGAAMTAIGIWGSLRPLAAPPSEK
jgi:hypothetical protein